MRLDELNDKLYKIYSEETCHPSYRNKWSEDNPTVGHCAIVSLLVNDLFGYPIYNTFVGNSRHFYNMNGKNIIDLTNDQFRGISVDYTKGIERDRNELLKNKDTRQRYEILKDKLAKLEKPLDETLTNNYTIPVYRVDSREDGNDSWSNSTRFFADDLSYFDKSDTGYSKKDAKKYLLNTKDFKVFDPMRELDLEADTWSTIWGTIGEFDSFDIYWECEDEDLDEDDPDYMVYTSTDDLAEAGRRLGYDVTILRDIPNDHGWGEPYTEYAVHNSRCVKLANASEFNKNSDKINEKLEEIEVDNEDCHITNSLDDIVNDIKRNISVGLECKYVIDDKLHRYIELDPFYLTHFDAFDLAIENGLYPEICWSNETIEGKTPYDKYVEDGLDSSSPYLYFIDVVSSNSETTTKLGDDFYKYEYAWDEFKVLTREDFTKCSLYKKIVDVFGTPKKVIKESLNEAKESLEDTVLRVFGEGQLEKGPMYLLPNGKLLRIPEPQQLGLGALIQYKCHACINAWLLYKKLIPGTLWDMNDETPLLERGWVRGNLGQLLDSQAIMNYIEIPKKKITDSQYETILRWLDYAQTIGVNSIEVDTQGMNKYKSYSFSDYTSDEIVDKIKKYYGTGRLEEKIVKKGNKWQVQSEKGRNMGTYDTKEEAEKRLKQIEYFKHINEDFDNFENQCKEVANNHYNEVIDILTKRGLLSNEPSADGGPQYILKDGRFVVLFDTEGEYLNIPYHSVVDEILVDEGLLTEDSGAHEYGSYVMYFMGAIRINDSSDWDEVYIQIDAENRPTNAQYDALLKFIDLCFNYKEGVEVMVGFDDDYDCFYSPTDYASDDVIKKIKRYYTTGKLNEDINSNQDLSKYYDEELSRQLSKMDKFLDKYGFEVEVVDDEDCLQELKDEDVAGMFFNSIQDNASVFPIGLNKDMICKESENTTDVYYGIVGTLAHEVGHGIFGYCNDMLDLDDLDEEKVVEEFAEDYEDNCLYNNELMEILKQSLDKEESLNEDANNKVIGYRSIGEKELIDLLNKKTIEGNYNIDTERQVQKDSNKELGKVVCFYKDERYWKDKSHLFFLKCSFNKDEVVGYGTGLYWAGQSLAKTKIWNGRSGYESYYFKEFYVKKYDYRNIESIMYINEVDEFTLHPAFKRYNRDFQQKLLDVCKGLNIDFEEIKEGLIAEQDETPYYFYRGYDKRYSPLDGEDSNLYTWITDDFEYAKEYSDALGKNGRIAKIEVYLEPEDIGNANEIIPENLDYLDLGDENFKKYVLDKGLLAYQFDVTNNYNGDSSWCLCVKKDCCGVVDKDVKTVESLTESAGIPITVYTYQSPKVREQLEKGKTYVASYSNANFSHYQDLSTLLGLNNCPIFGALTKRDLYRMLNSSGIDWEEENILHLEIPRDELHFMEYYDWTDYMYALDNQEEFEEESSITLQELENLIKTQKSSIDYEECQVVFDKIEPQWYEDGKDAPEEYESLEESLSQEVDNEGNSLTQEQIEFFKNSKVRDKDGKLIVCYHGTPNPGFKEFNPKSNKSQFGGYKFDNYNVNYFTTDRKSAASFTEIGIERDGNVYACYLNITNPYVVNNSTEAELRSSFNIKDSNLRKHQIELFDRIFNKWEGRFVSYGDFAFKELNNDLHTLNLELRPSDSYEDNVDDEDKDIFNLYDLGNNSYFGAEHPLEYYYTTDELFSDEMYDQLKEDVLGINKEFGDDEYFFSTDDVVRYVISLNKNEGTNYDGIIIPDIFDSKEMFSMRGTDYITLNSSNQIKLISNTNPTSSNKIDENSSLKEFYDEYTIDDLPDSVYNYTTHIYVTNDLYKLKGMFNTGSYRGCYFPDEDLISICPILSGIHDDLNRVFVDKGYLERLSDNEIRFLIFNKDEYEENDIDDEIDYYGVNIIQLEYDKFFFVIVDEGYGNIEDTKLYSVLGTPINTLEFEKTGESLKEDVYDTNGEYNPSQDPKYKSLLRKPINRLTRDDMIYLFTIHCTRYSDGYYSNGKQATYWYTGLRGWDYDFYKGLKIVEEDHSEEFDKAYEFFSSLQFPLKVYRAMRDDENEPSGKNHSLSWTTDINIFKKENSIFRNCNKIVEATITPDMIQNEWTVCNYIYYSCGNNYGRYPESEITLKPMFKTSKLNNLHFIDKSQVETLKESKQDTENFRSWVDKSFRKDYPNKDESTYEEETNSLVNKFETMRKSLKSPQNDYYYWIKQNNLKELRNFLDDTEVTLQTKKEEEDKAKQGAKLLYSKDGWKVYEITNYEASAKYGKGTKWCISGSKRWSNNEDGRQYWDDYVNKGIKFYFFIDKDEHKYALAIYPNNDFELFNELDASIGYIPNAPIVKEIPVDYYTKNDFRVFRNLFLSNKLPNNLSEKLILDLMSNDTRESINVPLEDVVSYVDGDIPDWYLEFEAVKDGLISPLRYKELTGDTYEEDEDWDGDFPFVNVYELIENFNLPKICATSKQILLSELKRSLKQNPPAYVLATDFDTWSMRRYFPIEDFSELVLFCDQRYRGDGDENWIEACYNYLKELVKTGEVSKDELKQVGLNLDEALVIKESKQDLERFRQWAGDDLYNRFFKQKDRLEPKYRDIYFWMNPKIETDDLTGQQILSNTLDSLENVPTRKQRDERGKEGAELIYEDNDWKVYHILSYEGAVKYGKGTKWCITGKNTGDDEDGYHDYIGGKRYWDSYSSKGSQLYFYIPKNSKTSSRKYALDYNPSTGYWTLFDDGDWEQVGSWMDYTKNDSWNPFDSSQPHFPTVDGLPDINSEYERAKTELGYITEELSKEQQDYFKNSVVRDEQGNLLPVYHSSYNKFDTFEGDGRLYWFAQDRDYAKDNFGGGMNVYDCYINLVHPFRLDECGCLDDWFFDEDEDWGDATFDDDSVYDIPVTDTVKNIEESLGVSHKDIVDAFMLQGYADINNVYFLTKSSEFGDMLRAKGYDGVIAIEGWHWDDVTYGVLNANQIKRITNIHPTSSDNMNETWNIATRGYETHFDKNKKSMLEVISNYVGYQVTEEDLDSLWEIAEDEFDEELLGYIEHYNSLDESLNEQLLIPREEVLEIMEDELGSSETVINGPSYILPNGNFLKIDNANIDIKGMSGNQSKNGKAMHLDVFGWLDKRFKDEHTSLYDFDLEFLAKDCIRVNNNDLEHFVVMPIDRPTEAQFKSLLSWLDDLSYKRKDVLVMDAYGSWVNHKEYSFDEYIPDEIIKKIKKYYSIDNPYDRTLEEALDEDTLTKIKDKFGISDELTKGALYLLPSGEFLKTGGAHRNIEQYLDEQGLSQYGDKYRSADGSPTLERNGAIRVNAVDKLLYYIMLSNERPTQAQYDRLIEVFDAGRLWGWDSVAVYTPRGHRVEYDFDTYSSEDIAKKIRYFYTTFILTQ